MNYKICSFLYLFLSVFIYADDNEQVKTDILFLKIQELELEIANLRNKVESQDYLIDKLISESINKNENQDSISIEELALITDVRFEGLDDSESKDKIYSAAIEALEIQNYEEAFNLFKYFVKSFNDIEKNPLSFFWLGEICLIENDFENSKNFFMELITSYPNHYRTPLAHKKIGDIYLKTNDLKNARDKYNYVIREYPNNTASSLALQLLKNME